MFLQQASSILILYFTKLDMNWVLWTGTFL